MTYRIAPAAAIALRQADLVAPNRNKGHDGLVGDAAHRERKSWHNPCNRQGFYDPNGIVLAFDVTHDPAGGFDAHARIREAVARGDARILEAISLGQIWTKARAAEGWRPYSNAASMPHDEHVHVSIAWEFQNSTAPWWPTKVVDEGDDEMQDADWERLNKMLDDKIRLVLSGKQPDGRVTHVDNLHSIRADIAALQAEVQK